MRAPPQVPDIREDEDAARVMERAELLGFF